MTKLVVLHPSVYEGPDSVIESAFNSDVFSVKFTEQTTPSDILSSVSDSVSHLAFVYHYPGNCVLPFFNESLTTDKYVYFNNDIINIIQTLRDANPSLVVDIISCLLHDELFKNEVARLEDELNINIRYSTDVTGNPSSGANWVMESELPEIVNIKDTYFTDDILTWQGVLNTTNTGNIRSGTGRNPEFITYNNTTKTFTLVNNVTWTAFANAVGITTFSSAFLTLEANEIFDGNGFTIDATTADGVFWGGLFAVSATGITKFTCPTIKNLTISNAKISAGVSAGVFVRGSQSFFKVDNCNAINCILGGNGGGIAGSRSGQNNGYFEITNSRASFTYTAGTTQSGGIVGVYSPQIGGTGVITGCYSTGTIAPNGGGITGMGAGYTNGTLTISNCYSTASISNNGGGITGSVAAQNGGIVTITNCYSTGPIGVDGGGITGSSPAQNSGTVTITNCYSKGAIGTNGGGISGSSVSDNGTCTISKCYSEGPIGPFAGGIIGRTAGSNNGTVTISECYSIGSIAADGGGITGDSLYRGTINKCYSTGSIGIRAGGICGPGPGNTGLCYITNCYSTGSIGELAGGIAGRSAAYNIGVCNITGCYSKGTIGLNAGGIAGDVAGELKGICNIDSCYSVGAIGENSGGIVAGSAGRNAGVCNITNCYSTGTIGLSAGGIAGIDAGGTFTNDDIIFNDIPENTIKRLPGKCNITNCYSTGTSGLNAGGIAGAISDTNIGTSVCNITKCACSASSVVGTKSSSTVTTAVVNSPTNLDSIDNNAYILFGWDNTKWATGQVLPILTVFTQSPWKSYTYTSITNLPILIGIFQVEGVSLATSSSPISLNTYISSIEYSSAIPTQIEKEKLYTYLQTNVNNLSSSTANISGSVVNKLLTSTTLTDVANKTFTVAVPVTVNNVLTVNLTNTTIVNNTNIYVMANVGTNVTLTLGNTDYIITVNSNNISYNGTSYSLGNTITLGGNSFTLSGLGSFVLTSNSSITPDTTPKPVTINLNVNVNADGEIKVFGSGADTTTNIITANTTIPVTALYDNTIGLIEFWESSDSLGNIKAQLANTNFGSNLNNNFVDAYKVSASRLAHGFQNVLCGSLNCSGVYPFANNSKYTGKTDYTTCSDFGRFALSVYADKLFGHAAATSAITNDTTFMKNILSLKSETYVKSDTNSTAANRYSDWSGAQHVNTTDVLLWDDAQSTTDANLAVKLVKSIIQKGLNSDNTLSVSDIDSIVGNTNTGTIANIVKQVIGQDATRAMGQDNNALAPEVHHLLRFYPNDKIFINITLQKPTVSVSSGVNSQQQSYGTINDSFVNSNDYKYTLEITLA